ncbi:MAG: hypothetical protein N3A66_10135, partial [Planctomycetota bacterium]|nr:hypothetical protein [Planctomycetota bacterium]
EDTYYMCTQIQRQCRGFSDEQVREVVRKIVTHLAESLNLQETQRMSSQEGGEQETEVNPPVRGPQRIEMETEIFSRQEIEGEAKKRRKRFEE